MFQIHRADWNWHHELGQAGWTLAKSVGNDTYWARPGKDNRDGHSAVLHGTDGPLVIFTTEINPSWTQAGSPTINGEGWSFGPFGFYAATRHNGDRKAAYAGLAAHYDPPAATQTTPDPITDPDGYDAELLGMLTDWGEFWSTDHKAEEWIWEPIIAAKRATAIFARGGVGKSLIVLRMVVDIVAAGTRVLYLDYEMTADDLADRLADMGVDENTDLDNLKYAQLPAMPAFDTPEGGRAVLRMAELVDAELVIIDTFARAVEGDENDADTVRQFYRMTGLHLKAAGRAFVRIDHAGKDDTKGQRGSSAKNDDVDVVWHLKRTETGYQLIANKRRMGWVPESVTLERDDEPFRLTVAGGDVYPVGTSEVARSLDELGVAVDESARNAAKALREAGQGARDVLVRAAQKYRRNRSLSFHFTGDEAVTEGGKSASRISGRGQSETVGTRPRDAAPTETVKTLATDLGRGAGRGGTRVADASGTRCVPPIGDARGQRDPETDPRPSIDDIPDAPY